MKTSFLQLIFVLACGLVTSSGMAQVYKPGFEPKPAAPAETKFPEASAFEKSNITCKIISAPKNTFCYDLFADGKLLIHQPSMPGMLGNEGFKTRQDAEKVAALVITKIKKGEMPPSVTTDEMKNLKVIK